MNKTELANAIAEDTGLSKKDAEAAVKSFVDTVSKELVAGNDVQIIGFGTFTTAERAEREGINPLTKEKITIAASKSAKFKAGKALKDLLNSK